MNRLLFGQYQHSLDTKGRVNFPAKLRDALGDRFMIAKGLGDRCLFVYSLEEWERLTEKINQLPLSKAKNLQRFLYSGAVLAETDKQGRILIPQVLRSYAGLQRELVIIGAANRAEIWDQALWEQLCSDTTAQVIAQAMEELEL